MWKVVFNPGTSDVVVDKEGGACYPGEWAAGFSSVVDPLIAEGKLVKVDVGDWTRETTDPNAMIAAERAEVLNKKREQENETKDDDAKAHSAKKSGTDSKTKQGR